MLSVFPNSPSFCITNASHLPPRKPPPFFLDLKEPKSIGSEEDDTSQLADTAERMHLDAQHELEGHAKASDVAGLENDTEVAKAPLLKGWQIDTEDGLDVTGKLITCAMGLGGRVIVGVGTNRSLWVWRYDE